MGPGNDQIFTRFESNIVDNEFVASLDQMAITDPMFPSPINPIFIYTSSASWFTVLRFNKKSDLQFRCEREKLGSDSYGLVFHLKMQSFPGVGMFGRHLFIKLSQQGISNLGILIADILCFTQVVGPVSIGIEPK